MAEARPYRPSNGTEGDAFMGAWCARCERDAARRRDPDNNDGCRIIVLSMALKISDAEYPKEWVRDENGPQCTAFNAVTGR